MSAPAVLAIAGGLLVVLELLTWDFTLLMVAFGLFCSAVALALSAPGVVAACLGFIVSVAALGFLRPLALRSLRQRASVRRGTDVLLGATGRALTAIDGSGQITLRGEVWSARAYDGLPIAAGSYVDVIAMEGATAAVLGRGGETGL